MNNKIILGLIALAAVVLAFSLGGLKAGKGDPNTDTLTIVETASVDPSLSNFAAILKVADLENTLNPSQEYTLFIPSNSAFAKIPSDALQNLLKPENRNKLKQLVAYHLIPNKLTQDDLHTGKIETANGKTLNVNVKGNAIKINNANVVKADIPASNGSVYVIDTILVPQQ